MEFLNKISVRDRINAKPIAGDIVSPMNGDIWYNSSLNKFRKYENGIVSDLDVSGGGGGTTPSLQAVTTVGNVTTNNIVIGDVTYTSSGFFGFNSVFSLEEASILNITNPDDFIYSTKVLGWTEFGHLSIGSLDSLYPAPSVTNPQMVIVGSNGLISRMAIPTGGSGNVVGPASAVNNNIALFNTTTGKLIKDAGKGVPSGAIVGTTDSQTLSNKETINLLNYGAITHEAQATTPASPAAGFVKLYSKTDGNFYKLTSGGVETSLVGAGGGGSGITRSVNNISTATTAGATASVDYVYFVSNTTTITLPTAIGNTNKYTIKNVGTGTVTIATTSSQTIDDGAAPITITQKNNSLDFISNGSNWKLI